MDIIIAIIFIAVLVILTVFFIYFILREPKNVKMSNKISEKIVYSFSHEREDTLCDDNLDGFVKFHKTHDFKKI